MYTSISCLWVDRREKMKSRNALHRKYHFPIVLNKFSLASFFTLAQFWNIYKQGNIYEFFGGILNLLSHLVVRYKV